MKEEEEEKAMKENDNIFDFLDKKFNFEDNKYYSTFNILRLTKYIN